MSKSEEKLMRVLELSLRNLTEAQLLQTMKGIDRYFTVLSFSDHYKAAFGIPQMVNGGCDDVGTLPEYSTVKEALIQAILRDHDFKV